MPSTSLPLVIATVAFWVVFLPVAAYILQAVCNVVGAEPPTFRRGVLVTALVGAAAFFTFDGLGYGIAMASRDSLKLNLPPGYSYLNWVREPLYLKWQVLGLLPLLRWLPVLIAVCLAATLYVFIFSEPFRNCLAILAIQWTLNVVAMAILSFVLSLVLRFVTPEPAPDGTSPAAEPGFTAVRPEERKKTRPGSRRTRPTAPHKETGKAPPAEAPSPAAEQDLKGTLAASEGAAAGSQLGQWREQLHRIEETLDPWLEPIKEASAPYTQHLPPAVQEFLDEGGWWLVLLGLAVAVLFWLRALWRRCRRLLFGKRRKRRSRERQLPVIDLEFVSDAFTELGEQQITVRGQPGRLRLVVLAPSPSYVGELLPEMADSLLDWLQPGLAEVAEADTPRRVVWPRHPSLGRFVEVFHKLVQAPEVKGRRSPWVLISGSAHLGRQMVYLGLAVFLDKTTYTREIQVEKEKWNEVLGLEKVTERI